MNNTLLFLLSLIPAALSAQASPAFPKPVPADSILRRTLPPLSYAVMRKADTERAFHNSFWNNHADGIYVDLITGMPLFGSSDKFESGTGWPSFTRPVAGGVIRTKTDRTFGMARTEVLSASSASHLGHLFNDGPAPLGTRYCMNSAALRFIPLRDMDRLGYGNYKKFVVVR